jgi:hypothetical protein
MAEKNIQDLLALRASNPAVAAALLVLDLLKSDQISAVADRLLGSGCDSPSLRILAGEAASVASNWLPVFKKAMGELKVQMPGRPEAARIVAREIATIIIENGIAPREGAQAMWDTLHLIKEFSPEITIFEELAWALDSGPDLKPFSELSREQIKRRIIDEARRIAAIDDNTVSRTNGE